MQMTYNCRPEKAHSIIMSATWQCKFQEMLQGKKNEKTEVAILNINISNTFHLVCPAGLNVDYIN